jgi:hypothetical protein
LLSTGLFSVKQKLKFSISFKIMSCWKHEWEVFLPQKAERARRERLENRRYSYPLRKAVFLNGETHPLSVLFFPVSHHTSLPWVIILLFITWVFWGGKSVIWGWIKWTLQALLFEMLELLNFPMLLIHTPTDTSVHLHAIRCICSKGAQMRQSNMVTHLTNWPLLAVQGIYALREHGSYRQHVSIGCWRKFTAMICCPDNGLPSGATRLHLASSERQSKWTTNILDDRIQHCIVGVVLRPDRSVTLELWHMTFGLSYNTLQRVVLYVLQHPSHCARRLSMRLQKTKLRVCCLSHVPAILFCRGKTSACVDSLLMTKLGSDFTLPLLSDQTCCGNTPVRSQRRGKVLTAVL